MTSVNGPDEVIDAVADRLRELGLGVANPSADGAAADLEVTAESGARWLVRHVPGPPATANQLETTSPSEGFVRAQAYVSRAAGERYRAMGVSYVDASGNCWITGPGVHLLVEGRPRRLTEHAGRDRASHAFRPSGLRAVFAILVRPDLANAPLRTLAEASHISLGAAQQARADLLAEGHLLQGPRGLHLSGAQGLASLWVGGYATRLRPKLKSVDLAGPGPQWWRDQALGGLPAQWGGDAGLVEAGLGLRNPLTTIVYADQPWGDLRRLARLTSDGEPNVTLRERFWEPALVWEGPAVPPLLLYADAATAEDPRLRELATDMREKHADLRRLF